MLLRHISLKVSNEEDKVSGICGLNWRLGIDWLKEIYPKGGRPQQDREKGVINGLITRITYNSYWFRGCVIVDG